MISRDGFFLLPAASTSVACIDGGFVQGQENYTNPNPNPNPNPNIPAGNSKRKRSLPGTPDQDAEVVALSPRSLMATNRFVCEVCNKGFQREQNLQLHRRGHNLPWKLKQKVNKDQVKKKVYICPEKSCVHHDPSRALGDLTGIKKHYSRKHGEKKWKCDKCSKKYAVMSDWKAHIKICGTREYKCDCGTIFSRKNSFITHQAFCEALTEERMRVTAHVNRQSVLSAIPPSLVSQRSDFLGLEPFSSTNGNNMGGDCLASKTRLPLWLDHNHLMGNHINIESSTSKSFLASSSSLGGFSPTNLDFCGASSSSSVPQGTTLPQKEEENRASYQSQDLFSLYSSSSAGNMSSTVLLQKSDRIGSMRSNNSSVTFASALALMRSSTSSLSSVSNNLANFNNVDDTLHQRHLFRQHMNDYSTLNDQLPMMGSVIHHGDNYNIEGSTQRNNKITSMRDFLGALGG